MRDPRAPESSRVRARRRPPGKHDVPGRRTAADPAGAVAIRDMPRDPDGLHLGFSPLRGRVPSVVYKTVRDGDNRNGRRSAGGRTRAEDRCAHGARTPRGRQSPPDRSGGSDPQGIRLRGPERRSRRPRGRDRPQLDIPIRGLGRRPQAPHARGVHAALAERRLRPGGRRRRTRRPTQAVRRRLRAPDVRPLPRLVHEPDPPILLAQARRGRPRRGPRDPASGGCRIPAARRRGARGRPEDPARLPEGSARSNAGRRWACRIRTPG